MTDTPERIALRWQPGAAVTNGPLMDHPDFTQYIRADVAAAMVAAEREACAALVDGAAFPGILRRTAGEAIRKRGQQ